MLGNEIQNAAYRDGHSPWSNMLLNKSMHILALTRTHMSSRTYTLVYK